MMKYVKKLPQLLSLVLCIETVYSDQTRCTDNFQNGKSVLFDDWCDDCVRKIVSYNQIADVFPSPPEDSNNHLAVLNRNDQFASNPFRVTDGSVISFRYAMRSANSRIFISISDLNNPSLSEDISIIQDDDWITRSIPWNKGTTQVMIEFRSILAGSERTFFALDLIDILINENGATCPGQQPSSTTTPTETTTSPIETTSPTETTISSTETTIISSTGTTSLTEASTSSTETSITPTETIDPSSELPSTEITTSPLETTTPTTESSTTDSSNIDCPENCDDLADELETWKSVAIAALSVGGIAVISTISISVLYVKKINSIPETAMDQFPKSSHIQESVF